MLEGQEIIEKKPFRIKKRKKKESLSAPLLLKTLSVESFLCFLQNAD